ncbi:MAG: c-type cytochrome [bacterium]
MQNAKTSRLSILIVTTFALFSFSLDTSAAFGQIPDEFTNLQVLAKDISKQELTGHMRNFAIGLGVRCQFCHVGEAGQPLSTFDFASDEKKTKKTARIMMQMVQNINGDHLEKISGRTRSIQVNCVTCHHGQSKPRMLEDVLANIVENEDAETAIKKYHELRENYYGGFTYDFSEGVLNNLAQRLHRGENTEAAIVFLNLNAELYPEAFSTYFFLGEIYLAKGEKELAIKNYKKVLEFQPNNRRVKQRLDELTQ